MCREKARPQLRHGAVALVRQAQKVKRFRPQPIERAAVVRTGAVRKCFAAATHAAGGTAGVRSRVVSTSNDRYTSTSGRTLVRGGSSTASAVSAAFSEDAESTSMAALPAATEAGAPATGAESGSGANCASNAARVSPSGM